MSINYNPQNYTFKHYLVGGAVRDFILEREVKDFDFVVVGSTINELLNCGLKQAYGNFPVFTDTKTQYQYALARTETKTGPGHRGFKIDSSSSITLEMDLKRRDFTINAMSYDFMANKIIDPYNGQCDLKNKILKMVTTHFSEDPLRILRGCRFAAQLDFNFDPSTLQTIQEMVSRKDLNELTADKINHERSKIKDKDILEKYDMLLQSLLKNYNR